MNEILISRSSKIWISIEFLL
uniref:Uncharacterized protein n=1 Tax=Romanomermis culicivorax TaxID=13658 RepID=A0A915HIM4_ROMCU